jgi:polysaccharide pyruvyl transferase WcaK-like protein
MKIGILNPCGTGNLGDEATLAAMIEETRTQYPLAQIYAVTTNPADTCERHKILAFPVRKSGCTSQSAKQDQESTPQLKARLKKLPLIHATLRTMYRGWQCFSGALEELDFLTQCLRRLKGTQLLIVAGSGQLSDHFGGAWAYPYTLFKWSVIAKVSGAKLAFVSVGAGPLRSAVSRAFINCCMRLADYRSFRDEESKQLIESIGVGGENHVFPDLVFHFAGQNTQGSVKESRIVGINPFPHYDHRYWPVGAPAEYQSYIEKLASFASWLIENDYKVLFLPTQLRADPLVIHDIKSLLLKNANIDAEQCIVDGTTSTIDDFLANLSATRIFVASRFHGILFSFLMNKPVLGLSNQPKMRNLMADMGQADYCLNVDDLDVQSLIDRFKTLDLQRASTTDRIQDIVSDHRRTLYVQYAQLWRLLQSEPGR